MGIDPPRNFDINGLISCTLSIPKYDIKFNFQYNKSTTSKLFAIFFSNIKPDVHASTKIKALAFYKGSGEGGWLLAKPNGGFAFKIRFVRIIFLLFGRAP